MRGVILVTAALVVAAFVPAAGAYHLSVGSQDAVLLQPSETPANPSVGDDLYDRGTDTNCFESDGSAEDLVDSVDEDSFCGYLVYNQGTGFDQTSTEDQDIPVSDVEFDAIFTTYAGGYGLSTCIPWCFPEGMQTPYEVAHDIGSEAGVTDDGEAAWQGDQGWQEYAPNYLVPNAFLVASEVAGLEGNGWLVPLYDESIVAFLNDGTGDPIDQDELNTMVEGLKASGDLHADAAPQVCAFTPDEEISINAPQSTFCEVLFLYAAENQPDTDASGEYQDQCSSPAYVCGALSQAWYAQLVCSFVLSGCAGSSGWDSTISYETWHFVVAPSQSACNGVAEPGFAFSTTATHPYIAHDLDVYTPPSAAAGVQGTEEAYLWTYDFQEAQGLEGALDSPGTGAVFGLAEDALPSEVRKDDTVEPNADPVGNIGETSKSTQNGFPLSRDLSEPCNQLAIEDFRDGERRQATGSTGNMPLFPDSFETTADPWVTQIDSGTFRDDIGDVFGGGAEELFLNGADHQDASNRPGPAMYGTSGMVGIFSDRNDDGNYDQAGSANLFTNIYSTGAYPMFWDMNLNTSQPNLPPSDQWCRPGFGDKTLPEQMDIAGYGQHTGLVQAVYLNEPTVLRHSPTTGGYIPFLDGNNLFVFMSQAMHVLYQQGDADVTGLVNDIASEFPGATVQVPNTLVSSNTDFDDQCGYATGGFANQWTFLHDCQALDCSGDTIVTAYMFEVTNADGTLGGGPIPGFDPDGDGSNHAFGTGIHTWFDVDPFDNDPSRNTQTDGTPPN